MKGSCRLVRVSAALLAFGTLHCMNTRYISSQSSEQGMTGAASAIGGNSCSHGDCEFNDRYQPCCDRYKECGANPKNLAHCDACITCIDELADNPEGCAKKFTCETESK